VARKARRPNLGPSAEVTSAQESAAPSTPAPRVPALRRRLACLAYEAVLLFGMIFLAALLYSMMTGQRHALVGRHGLALLAFVLVPGFYFIGYWHKTGQTLPMQTWQIRLETLDGQRLSLPRASARFMVAWAWVAPPLLVAASAGSASLRWLMLLAAGWIALYAGSSKLQRSGQFWHDLACRTRLVDTRAVVR
jgi:uncharacterized RDD family membrane protein YckC